MTGAGEILKAYAEEAGDIIPRFEALRTADVLAPVAGYLPDRPARVADIGAGTGRDAQWFAMQGHRVCAVEPVAELADYGRRAHSPDIEWVADQLPGLPVLRAAARRFDLVIVGSVWHHLDAADSTASLDALAASLDDGGRLVISLKEFAADDPAAGATLSSEDVLSHIAASGLDVIHISRADPHQDHNKTAGNMWTWLVLARRQKGAR